MNTVGDIFLFRRALRERITALVSRLTAHRFTISWRFISNDI